MNHTSIKSKLLVFVGVLVTSLVMLLTLYMWLHLNAQNEKQNKQVQSAIYSEAQRSLTAQGRYYAQRVGGFINEAYRVPFTFSGVLNNSAQTQPLPRDVVQNAVAGALQQNKFISSMYAQFEANGYDNKDAQYKTGASHSVAQDGTLEIYFTRDAAGISQQKVVAAADKYLDSKNEFGLREAEWYLCAKDKNKPCIMEPYLYDGTLMTSLTVPVQASGRFVGLVGVDVNLPIFQQQVEELSNALYNGAAKVTLLSELGLVVGSSHYDNLARPLKESMPTSRAQQLLGLHQSKDILEIGDDIALALPISIKLANTTWSLLIEVPKEVVLAQARSLAKELEESANSLSQTMLVVGVLVAMVGIAIAIVLINTIIKPLTHIQQRIENLASSEGDLTHKLEVSAHAELIALARGFNLFTDKLRNMIDDLKQLAEQSYQQSFQTTEVAINIKNKVANQHNEIDSVVAAINELSATASEVARSSEQAAQSANDAAGQVQKSEASIVKTNETVQKMASQVLDAKQAINKVVERSADISQILDVIRAIAEQTNLLALNAAIEAARAGEQGRGFAVVADEVRALASKTHASTNDISKLIDNLTHEVHQSEEIIESSVSQGELAVSFCEESAQAMGTLVQMLANISNEVTQIATAAEEQSVVTEEINSNTTGISDAARELSQLADQVEKAASTMTLIVEQKHTQLNLLKTK
ncbi:Methyl-accepting chemotaxis protein McpU [Pseudoalteromonas holothuriae]|uniref:Methyl-accepting chemotaxis protein McpU n=1 Tax=Pseudoalteromonas holothuriae TaxID=2963714 RepID=A0ABM9GKU6_9GAMM|nr:methyl-accepting chemotaxis protein [Pseudoalteromonas sp. CIP111951]CAH9064053.1 Methyl-accepting chemotaxis protein McpU [Pseudoalteromonas sp. CIP111951]